MGMTRAILWAPLALFVAFVGVVAIGLGRPPETTIASRMVGKPLPRFALDAATPDKPALSSADFVGGRPRLLNIFASWCVPCAAETPQLLALKGEGVPIEAIAIRDRPADLAAFLRRNGDPFERIGADRESKVQMALGSSGVPETFVIDGRGVIRHQHIGPLTPADLPALRAAIAAAAR